MPRTKIDLFGKEFGLTRETIRNNLIQVFLRENAGTGKGNKCSVYIYNVEKLSDGEIVFLKRPARLNKGFDFEINVSGYNFGKQRKTTMPNHDCILTDLELKKKESSSNYKIFKLHIDDLFYCKKEVSDVELQKIKFNSGYPIDLTFKVIKWFFIEQDITYWNWSGRSMLYSGISIV